MGAISTTVTAGNGSERHNHDLDYRKTLKHVHSSPDGVIELTDYVSYKTQINEMMKPFIDEYNADADRRYQEAWERYKAGERKSKPKRRDYAHMEYDYYATHKNAEIMNPHTNKKEHVPIFRSLIIGLGDKSDRHTGVISKEQAEAVFREFLEAFREKFPHLKVLGATIHLDEEGFFHMHLDYKPVMAAEFSKGLQCTVSQEAVLEAMGFEPEQSIINGRDKAPLRFNAFRNQIYYAVEKALNHKGLRLQYGVSQTKEPGKDSGKNQSLENWQAQQDAALEMQALKNDMLDIIEKDEVSPAGYKDCVSIVESIKAWWKNISNTPIWRRRKDGVVIEFHAFDQLQSMVEKFFEVVGHLFKQISHWQERAKTAEQQLDSLEAEVEQLRPLAKAVTPELIEQAQFFEYTRLTGRNIEETQLWTEFQADKVFMKGNPDIVLLQTALQQAENAQQSTSGLTNKKEISQEK